MSAPRADRLGVTECRALELLGDAQSTDHGRPAPISYTAACRLTTLGHTWQDLACDQHVRHRAALARPGLASPGPRSNRPRVRAAT